MVDIIDCTENKYIEDYISNTIIDIQNDNNEYTKNKQRIIRSKKNIFKNIFNISEGLIDNLNNIIIIKEKDNGCVISYNQKLYIISYLITTSGNIITIITPRSNYL